jgi:hypothetical protein
MTTGANCWITDADGNSNFKIMEKLKNFFDTRADNHELVDSFNDLLTDNCRGLIVKNHNTKHEFMLQVSGSSIKCIMHPASGSDVSLSFGSNVSSGSSDYVTPLGISSFSSPEINALNFGSLPGNTLHIAEYSDSFFFATKYANAEYWYQCLNVGKVYIPSNFNDPEIGLDGCGILGGVPHVSHANGSSLWASNNTVTSVIRTGHNTWTPPVAFVEPNSLQASDLNGSIRMVEIPIKAGQNGPLVGYTKYVRQYKNSGGHLGYIISGGEDDQAWVRYRYSSNDYHLCMLWNKNVLTKS